MKYSYPHQISLLEGALILDTERPEIDFFRGERAFSKDP